MGSCGNDKKKAFLTKPSARVKNRIDEIAKMQRESEGTLRDKTVYRARVVALPSQEAAGVTTSDGSPIGGITGASFAIPGNSEKYVMINYIRVFDFEGVLPDPGEPGISTRQAVNRMGMHGPAYAPQHMNLKCGDIINVQYDTPPTNKFSSGIPKVITKFESDDAYAKRVRANLGKSTNLFIGLDSASFLGATTNIKAGKYLGNLITVTSKRKIIMTGTENHLKPTFKRLIRGLQTFFGTEYPELGLRTDDSLGRTRPLQDAIATSNPNRAPGSKHGAGVAQDTYLHTADKAPGIGEYTSYSAQNPVLARDKKTIITMRKYRDKWNASESQKIVWGGDFGFGGNYPPPTSSEIRSRGILEFHHWEIPGRDIPTYLLKDKDQFKKVGFSESDLNLVTSERTLKPLYEAIVNYLGAGGK